MDQLCIKTLFNHVCLIEIKNISFGGLQKTTDIKTQWKYKMDDRGRKTKVEI